ncbi:MAG: DUF1351 domain-containing protein [Oscillospiraceae bacterium]|nr:DUF1351 domain-containing protein [Oscillospiraceae bacterium]
MQKNELYVIESTDIGCWDFEMLRTQLIQALSEYDSRVYTDKASAKDDVSKLNKIIKVIEDKRKEYKKKCMEPYQEIEIKSKMLTSIIDEKKVMIAETVELFETERKNARQKDLREFYNQKSDILGSYADKLFDKIVNPRWLNVTTSSKKYQEEILIAISNARSEIDQLNILKSPYIDTLIDDYINGASFKECVQKNEVLLEANKRAGITSDTNMPAAVPQAEIINAKDNIGNEKDSVTIRIKNIRKLDMITDFLKAIGADFEIVE